MKLFNFLESIRTADSWTMLQVGDIKLSVSVESLAKSQINIDKPGGRYSETVKFSGDIVKFLKSKDIELDQSKKDVKEFLALFPKH